MGKRGFLALFETVNCGNGASIAFVVTLLALGGCSGIDTARGANSRSTAAQAALPLGMCRVEDGAGNPIPDANITSLSSKWVATTDAQGEFVLPDLHLRPRDSLELSISATGFLPRTLITSAGGGRLLDPADGSLILHRGCRIEGVVLGPDGHPLAGAPLSLDAMELYGRAFKCTPGIRQTFTDDAGHFVFDDAPPGIVFISYPLDEGGLCRSEVDRHMWNRWVTTTNGVLTPVVPVKGYVSGVSLTLEDGQSVANVVLDLSKSTGVIVGRATDREGRPVKGAAVMLSHRLEMSAKFPKGVGGSDEIGCSSDVTISAFEASTDFQGRYYIDHIPPGQWLIRANTNNCRAVLANVGAGLTDVDDIVIDR